MARSRSVSPDAGRNNGSRTLRACDACRSKKIKCDAVKPACDGCKHAKIPCTYLKPHRKRARLQERNTTAGQAEPAFLEPRVDELEKLVKQLTESISNVPTKSQASQPAEKDHKNTQPAKRLLISRGYSSFNFDLLQEHLRTVKLGSVNSYDGYSFFSPEAREWIKRCTGEDVDIASLLKIVWPFPKGLKRVTKVSTLDTINMPLPGKEVVKHCVSLYISSTSYQIFPVLDCDLFSNIIETVYGEKDQVDTASGKAHVFTFLSFAAKTSLVEPGILDVDPDGYSQAALQLLPSILLERPSIGGLEALLSMCFHQAAFGTLELLQQLISVARRMVFSLGGHLRPEAGNHNQPTPSDSGSDKPSSGTSLRSLFWLCYAYDKDVCLRTLQPPSINDDDCDLDIPTDYVPITTTALTDTEIDGVSFYVHDLQLARVKSNIYRSLYSATALRKSDGDLLKTIRELDEELDDWRSALPILLRPERPQVQGTSVVTQNMRLTLLHLEYYQCVTMIHRASTRCRCWIENGLQGVPAIESSVDLCVEASRCQIHYMEASRSLGGEERIWLVSYYAGFSLLTLFCKVLEYPNHPRAMQDYALLCGAPLAIAEIDAPIMKKEDANHLKLVVLVFNELLRLAKCALDRAPAR